MIDKLTVVFIPKGLHFLYKNQLISPEVRCSKIFSKIVLHEDREYMMMLGVLKCYHMP